MISRSSRRLRLIFGAIGIGAAGVLWRVLVLVAPHTSPASVGERFGAASTALLPACLVLLAMVLAQMAARFASAALDPTAGRDTRFLQMNQRAITNTIEQMAIFAPSLLALAANVPGGSWPGIPALAGCFAAARIVFWFGYLIAPAARAPGMAGTLAVSITTAIWAGWVAFK
jgi:uncharacterized MAPEG superfamily protein